MNNPFNGFFQAPDEAGESRSGGWLRFPLYLLCQEEGAKEENHLPVAIHIPVADAPEPRDVYFLNGACGADSDGLLTLRAIPVSAPHRSIKILSPACIDLTALKTKFTFTGILKTLIELSLTSFVMEILVPGTLRPNLMTVTVSNYPATRVLPVTGSLVQVIDTQFSFRDRKQTSHFDCRLLHILALHCDLSLPEFNPPDWNGVLLTQSAPPGPQPYYHPVPPAAQPPPAHHHHASLPAPWINPDPQLPRRASGSDAGPSLSTGAPAGQAQSGGAGTAPASVLQASIGSSSLTPAGPETHRGHVATQQPSPFASHQAPARGPPVHPTPASPVEALRSHSIAQHPGLQMGPQLQAPPRTANTPFPPPSHPGRRYSSLANALTTSPATQQHHSEGRPNATVNGHDNQPGGSSVEQRVAHESGASPHLGTPFVSQPAAPEHTAQRRRLSTQDSLSSGSGPSVDHPLRMSVIPQPVGPWSSPPPTPTNGAPPSTSLRDMDRRARIRAGLSNVLQEEPSGVDNDSTHDRRGRVIRSSDPFTDSPTQDPPASSPTPPGQLSGTSIPSTEFTFSMPYAVGQTGPSAAPPSEPAEHAGGLLSSRPPVTLSRVATVLTRASPATRTTNGLSISGLARRLEKQARQGQSADEAPSNAHASGSQQAKRSSGVDDHNAAADSKKRRVSRDLDQLD